LAGANDVAILHGLAVVSGELIRQIAPHEDFSDLANDLGII
jgi:hypothetical protein